MSALMLLQKLDPEISQTMIRSWGWYLAFGIALSLLGVAAIIRSVTATVLTMFFFGWVLVISAAIEVAQAFMVGAWVGFLVHALSAVLFGVIGLLLITRPLLAAEVATLLTCDGDPHLRISSPMRTSLIAPAHVCFCPKAGIGFGL